jgi:hypothetical protein
MSYTQLGVLPPARFERRVFVMQVRPFIVFFSSIVFVASCTIPAFSDSQSVSNCTNCNGYTFKADLNPVSGKHGEYSLTYKITNISGKAAQPYSWSLTLFESGSAISPAGPLSMSNGDQTAYLLMRGKSNNGNANCNGAVGNAICVKPSGAGTPKTLLPGQSVTFTFDILCSNCRQLADWIFLSQGNCIGKRGNCYAISTTGKPVSVPEPSIIALYVCTLGVLGGFALWRRRRVLRPPNNALFGLI